MATVDLSGYNLGDLKGLQRDLENEMKNRQQDEMRKAREQIRAIALAAGVSVEELIATTSRKPEIKKKQTVKAKYQNPADTSQTWTGRGRQPKWISEGLAGGKTLNDYRV